MSHGAFFIVMATTRTSAMDRREYMAAYYRRRREEIRRRRHAHYLENREDHIATVQQARQRATVTDEERPPIRRRWLVIGDRVYFNSRLGISASEMKTVISDLRASIARQTGDPEEFARNATRQRKHLRHLNKRAADLEKMRIYRQNVLGSTPRQDEPVGSRITVSNRRWLIVGNRLYFNPKVELTLQDVQRAASELRRSALKS